LASLGAEPVLVLPDFALVDFDLDDLAFFVSFFASIFESAFGLGSLLSSLSFRLVFQSESVMRS